MRKRISAYAAMTALVLFFFTCASPDSGRKPRDVPPGAENTPGPPTLSPMEKRAKFILTVRMGFQRGNHSFRLRLAKMLTGLEYEHKADIIPVVINSLKAEEDSDVTAQLLRALGNLSFGTAHADRAVKIAEPYLFHCIEGIRKAAALSLFGLGAHAERLKYGDFGHGSILRNR